mmetsp:Transcript_33082/g.72131  ORF Transcript_33082/g.72131 Transcript_33082/m.72131 type:complete len:204 (-) Transcript_33082:180-791(-)
MPGVGLAHVGYESDSKKFYEEIIEKENKWRRSKGIGPSQELIKEMIAKQKAKMLPPLEELPPPTALKPDGTPYLKAQVAKNTGNLSAYWPKLKGRDATALTSFLSQSPIDVTPYGQPKILPQLKVAAAMEKKKLEYQSHSAQNFSNGVISNWTNKHRAEEVKEYMESFNSPICYTNPKHRTTYGEFSAFVHKTGRPLYQGHKR